MSFSLAFPYNQSYFWKLCGVALLVREEVVLNFSALNKYHRNRIRYWRVCDFLHVLHTDLKFTVPFAFHLPSMDFTDYVHPSTGFLMQVVLILWMVKFPSIQYSAPWQPPWVALKLFWRVSSPRSPGIMTLSLFASNGMRMNIIFLTMMVEKDCVLQCCGMMVLLCHIRRYWED